jgi:hypothetical protein
LIGHGHDEFIEQIENALRRSKTREQISDLIRNESWESKIEELRGIIANCERPDPEVV